MTTSIARMDRYWAGELGCTPEALYRGGVTVCAPEHRAGPRWMGWMVPVDCVRVEAADPDTGIVSLTPRLEDAFCRGCRPPFPADDYLPPRGDTMVRFMHEQLPTAVPKTHHILYCDESCFAPADDVLRVSCLQPGDPNADWFRLHFDGPVYAARNDWGTIVSWAALKCKSDDIWELAVVTDIAYRGRGLARSVVSHATRAAMAAGKLPIYLHEVSNTPSSRVCRALGYRFYGYELTCEYGRVTSRR
jgi:hypothetical protein